MTVRLDKAGQPKMNGTFMHLIPQPYVGESIYAPCKSNGPSGRTLVYISDTSWALLPKNCVAPVPAVGVVGGGFLVPSGWEHLKFTGVIETTAAGSGRMIFPVIVTDRNV
jgi:hypothetical protein